MGAEVFHALKKVLVKRKLSTGVGDEGGFAPDLKNDEEAITVILEAIEAAGYEPGKQVCLALDCGGQRTLRQGEVHVQEERGGRPSAEQMVEMYAKWLAKYPIVSIEDGLAEDDWAGWSRPDRRARRSGAARRRRPLRHQRRPPGARHRGGRGQRHPHQGQPDRHGHRDARDDGARPPQRLPPHHLAPLGRDRGHLHRRPRRRHQCGQIKTGSASRTDRVAKYNQLLRIEELGATAGVSRRGHLRAERQGVAGRVSHEDRRNRMVTERATTSEGGVGGRYPPPHPFEFGAILRSLRPLRSSWRDPSSRRFPGASAFVLVLHPHLQRAVATKSARKRNRLPHCRHRRRNVRRGLLRRAGAGSTAPPTWCASAVARRASARGGLVAGAGGQPRALEALHRNRSAGQERLAREEFGMVQGRQGTPVPLCRRPSGDRRPLTHGTPAPCRAGAPISCDWHSNCLDSSTCDR